ncbi:MAG: hypothetical protein II845_08700 [Oscillospiraceae bacterium]|nr:hypothetical protein [Oscillospiraceae bacterium]
MKHLFKKTAEMLLAVMLVLSVLAGLPGGTAEAASYMFHHEVIDGNTYYYVYQNKSELEETPTFISSPWDVYYSDNTENSVRITFYRSYNIKNSKSQGEAFYKYLLKHSDAKEKYAGWYTMTQNFYGYDESVTVAYLVEGLNPRWEYHFECLWDWNPFRNSNGTTLNLEYGDTRDLWDRMNTLWNEGCSAVLTIYGKTKSDISSFGMIFTEGADRHIVRRYCVYETWN